MTTGNVSAQKDLSAALFNGQGQSVKSTGTGGQTTSFQSYMSAGTEKGTKIQDPASSVKTPSGNTPTADQTGTTSKVKDILKSDTTDKTASDDTVTTVLDSIKDVIRNILGISDEDLTKRLADLGLTVTDLLVPQNLVQLVASVNNTEPSKILTDDTLSGQLKDLMQEIQTTLSQSAKQIGIPVEDLVNQLKAQTPQVAASDDETGIVYEDKKNPVSDPATNTSLQKAAETVVKVQDESTGKTIEITFKGNTAETTVTDQVKAPAQNQNFGSGNGKEEKDMKGADPQTAGQTVLQNLKSAVGQTIQTPFGQTLSEVQTPVLNQIIDAVKVQATPAISSMEIQLTPENLGKINLTVAAKDGIVTATILTQNESVKTAVENQLYQLKDTLNNQGIKVQNVEVAVADQSFWSGAEHGDNGSNQKQNSDQSRRFRGIDELPEEDSITMTEALSQAVIQDTGSSLNLKA